MMFVTAFSSCFIKPIGSESKSGIDNKLIEGFTQEGVKKSGGSVFRTTTPDPKDLITNITPVGDTVNFRPVFKVH